MRTANGLGEGAHSIHRLHEERFDSRLQNDNLRLAQEPTSDHRLIADDDQPEPRSRQAPQRRRHARKKDGL